MVFDGGKSIAIRKTSLDRNSLLAAGFRSACLQFPERHTATFSKVPGAGRGETPFKSSFRSGAMRWGDIYNGLQVRTFRRREIMLSSRLRPRRNGKHQRKGEKKSWKFAPLSPTKQESL